MMSLHVRAGAITTIDILISCFSLLLFNFSLLLLPCVLHIDVSERHALIQIVDVLLCKVWKLFACLEHLTKVALTGLGPSSLVLRISIIVGNIIGSTLTYAGATCSR